MRKKIYWAIQKEGQFICEFTQRGDRWVSVPIIFTTRTEALTDIRLCRPESAGERPVKVKIVRVE